MRPKHIIILRVSVIHSVDKCPTLPSDLLESNTQHIITIKMCCFEVRNRDYKHTSSIKNFAADQFMSQPKKVTELNNLCDLSYVKILNNSGIHFIYCSPLTFYQITLILFLCARHRRCTHSCPPSWTPTPSPARTRRRRRKKVRVQRAGRRKEGTRTTCPPCQPKWLGWWRSTAALWCCHGRPVCPHHSPPRPSATSSSSPTPPCSTLCWREVRG